MLELPLGIPGHDDDGLSFHIAQITEACSERLLSRRHRRLRQVGEKGEPEGPGRRGAERRGEEPHTDPPGKAADERASIHPRTLCHDIAGRQGRQTRRRELGWGAPTRGSTRNRTRTASA